MHTRLPVFLALATAAAARWKNDFSMYPDDTQSCLEEADKNSECDFDAVPKMNACLCSSSDSPFLSDAAACIGKESPSDLRAVYKQLNTNCAGTNTALDISQSEFLEMAEEDEDEEETTSATTSSTSTTASPKPTDTDEPEPEPTDEATSGLSTGATAGIAVAATAVGVSAIAAAIFFILRKRRLARAARPESNPMLGGGGAGVGVPAAALARDSAYVSPYQDADPSKSPAPVWGPQSFSNAPPMQQQQWGGGAAPVQAGGNEVYELASTDRLPHEMPGSHPGPGHP